MTTTEPTRRERLARIAAKRGEIATVAILEGGRTFSDVDLFVGEVYRFPRWSRPVAPETELERMAARG